MSNPFDLKSHGMNPTTARSTSLPARSGPKPVLHTILHSIHRSKLLMSFIPPIDVSLIKASRLAVLACCALQGCTPLMPKYERPTPLIESAFPSSDPTLNKEKNNSPSKSSTSNAQSVDSLSWQEFVTDPALRSVIALALENNRDLRVAALQIEKSQAQFKVSSSSLFPQINASLSNTATKTPANLTVSGQVSIMHDYTSGLGFSAYELDMFGRLQSLKAAAFEQYLSTSQAALSVRISLIAQVAAQYLTLSADQSHLHLAEQTLDAQIKSYEIDKKRFDLGVISELDLSQSRTSIETARVDISRYKSLVVQDLNLLNLLVGKSVPTELLPKDFLAQSGLTTIAPGLPSDLLRSRPDIMDAEHQLIAANANIGAARAAYFPTITMTTLYGSASPSLSGLFGPGSRSWLFVPQVYLPIFDGGRIASNLRIAETNQKIALEVYQKAIQSAFREVADALAVQDNIKDELSAQESLVQATALSFKLSQARYQNGINSYLNVLDSERSLYAAKHNLINLKLLQAANQFTLYKALGAGVQKPQ